MKLFLHIGTEKTGTTVIQNILIDNQVKLKKMGVLIPNNLGRPNHRSVPLIAYDKNRRDDETLRCNVQTDDQLISLQNHIISKMETIIQLGRTEKVVFSSEHLQSRLTTTREVWKLKRLLNEVGFKNIKVILYIRHPAALAMSLYSTAIKTGSFLNSVPKPDHPYWENICDHKNTLIRWSNVFGKENIVARIYEKSSLNSGSIINDFLEIVGITVDSLVVKKKENKSLSLLGLNILRNVNQNIPRYVDGVLNQDRFGLVNYFERYFSNDEITLTSEIFNLYNDRFKSDFGWIRRNYFPNRNKLFHDSLSINNEVKKYSEKEIKLIADFISELWIKIGNNG